VYAHAARGPTFFYKIQSSPSLTSEIGCKVFVVFVEHHFFNMSMTFDMEESGSLALFNLIDNLIKFAICDIGIRWQLWTAVRKTDQDNK
jgi:hypothetical protein